MLKDNFNTPEQRRLSFGAARLCVLELRQRARATGDEGGDRLASMALEHMDAFRPVREPQTNVVDLHVHRINPINALIALEQRGEL